MKYEHIDALNETLYFCKKYGRGTVVESKLYNNIDYMAPNIKEHFNETQISVIDCDVLDAGVILKRKGYNPLVLNMSDDEIAGPQNLFRRTNYMLTLLQEYYPLRNADCVYSPSVLVLRTNEKTGYKWYDSKDRMYVSMIACPAIKCPKVVNEVFADKSDRDLMERKIRAILTVAVLHEHDSIILSVHGCCIKGPRIAIAKLYKDVISEFEGCFKLILFAIMKKDYTNYKIFNEILS